MSISLTIPVDNEIERFNNHLLSHERTILSAGFGEGKTYFLNRCRETLENVCFITLYPINYQILNNRDIYDVMKRDILFQLVHSGIIETEKISESVAVSFFILNSLSNDISNVYGWMMRSLSDIGYPTGIAVKIFDSVRKFAKDLKKRFGEFKKKYNINDGLFEDFWDATKSKAFYDSDPITTLIREGVNQWREKSGKRIVLLIEDMDRIDPAQLFRILNVLSAQVDLCMYMCDTDTECLIGNKFNFDNIVCVLDLANFHSIYHHFYGAGSSADGYISKFSNKGAFEYSLTHQKIGYVQDLLCGLTGFQKEIIKRFVGDEVINKKSMRTIVSALEDIDSQINYPAPIMVGGVKKNIPQNLLRFISILLRLGIAQENIKDTLVKEFNKGERIHDELIPFALINANMDNESRVYFGERPKDRYWLMYDFSNQNPDNPNIEFSKTNYGSFSRETKVDCTSQKMIENMLSCIWH